jgi:hypothetical protein
MGFMVFHEYFILLFLFINMTVPLAQGELNGIPPLAVRSSLSSAHSGIWLSTATGL